MESKLLLASDNCSSAKLGGSAFGLILTFVVSVAVSIFNERRLDFGIFTSSSLLILPEDSS